MKSIDHRGPASAGPFFKFCQRLLKRFDQFSAILVVLAMATMAALVVTQVVFRYGFSSAIDWSEEVARLAFVWAMFLAIPHGIRHGSHVGIDALVTRFSWRLQRRLFSLSAILGAVLMSIIFYVSTQVTIATWPERMPTLDLTASAYYIAVLIAAAHSIAHLVLLAWGGPATWSEAANA